MSGVRERDWRSEACWNCGSAARREQRSERLRRRMQRVRAGETALRGQGAALSRARGRANAPDA
eukprot:1110879-Rhodomonas_salina.2